MKCDPMYLHYEERKFGITRGWVCARCNRLIQGYHVDFELLKDWKGTIEQLFSNRFRTTYIVNFPTPGECNGATSKS